MNIVAIDSITPALSVAASGPRGKAIVTVTESAQHAENMIALIEKAIDLAGFTAKETNLACCAEGPGSFTGLRLAYSAAKAIQLASNCGLFPIPPLELYAKAAGTFHGVVISAMDAKKQRFYVQFFRMGSKVTEPLDLAASECAAYVDPSERIAVTGPDADLFAEELTSILPNSDITSLPSGVEGISGAMISFAQNAYTDYTDPVPDHAGPVYVRKSDAESNAARP